MNLAREYSARWPAERWADAVAEAKEQAAQASRDVVVAKAGYVEACHDWVAAEEWVATLEAARACFASALATKEAPR